MPRTRTELQDPRCPAAVLRALLALRRNPDAGLEKALSRVVKESAVEPQVLRSFLASHMELVAGVLKGEGREREEHVHSRQALSARANELGIRLHDERAPVQVGSARPVRRVRSPTA